MTQLIEKFIGNNQVSGAKIRLRNAETFRARNAADSADVNLFRLTNADVWQFDQLPQASASLPLPSQAKQFATVEYIENFINGKTDAKDAVDLLSDTVLTLSGSTPLSIDGVTVTDGMRIAQVAGSVASNGIYVATISGGTYTLARAADFDQVNDASGKEVTKGAYFKIIQGTTYGGWEALLTTNDPIVIDTTALTFVLNPTIQALTAGDMLKRIGNDFSIDLASLSGLESTNAGNATGQLRVKTDTAVLEADQSTRRDPITGAVVARVAKKLTVTLNNSDITNQYVDALDVAGRYSVDLGVVGAPDQFETDDYTVNYTGGSGGKTRITFAGGLAAGGVSELVVGDKITVRYTAFP